MSDYSFSNFIGTAFSLLITKIAYPKARLVRRPIYIRGRKGIKYDEGLTTGHSCRFDASREKVSLRIGKNARFGDFVHINANDSVTIGDNLLSASKVFISDASHGIYNGENQSSPEGNPSEREIITKPVVIGNNVWIGENAVVLPGSVIGDGCIIGANSVVLNGVYPSGSIIVGCPAKIVKVYNKKTKSWNRV